jgi:hypothetical protein
MPTENKEYAPWVEKFGLPFPYGKCQCGCGQDVPIATHTYTDRYLIKGAPVRYKIGHGTRCTLTMREYFFSLLPIGDPDACWKWPRLNPDQRYGYFKYRYRKYYAHRVSYEIHHGPIPEGMCVCHHCDNPPCCNPAHLFLGTDQDNVSDMIAKGRNVRGEDMHASKLTESQVLEIRYLYSIGWLQADLSAAFGVTPSSVSSVITGKSWKHLPGAMRYEQKERHRRHDKR